jgi:hypothetical protein
MLSVIFLQDTYMFTIVSEMTKRQIEHKPEFKLSTS